MFTCSERKGRVRMFPGRGLGPNLTTLQYLMHAPSFIRLFWRLFTDKRVSALPKLVLLLGVAYTLWPLDALPDFPLVGLGWLDDGLVLYLAAKGFIHLCPPHVVAEHVELISKGA